MIFDFGRPLQPPPQLQWRYADERALMAWTIRARNYNTLVANGMFGFMLLVDLVATYAIYVVRIPSDSDFKHLTICFGFFVLMAFTISLMTHQRMNFAYRLTQSGVEYCKWKDFPQWALTFLNWFAGIAAVICVSLASTDPALLIGALIGPGGIGLVYLVKVNSRSYQAMQAEYHHHAFKWTAMTQLAVATNREVVNLKYCIPREHSQYMIYWSLNIFCKRKEKQVVADLIKLHLPPDVPYIVAKVNVPLSTD